MKSNIGHSESSSGTCSIAKVLLAFEKGLVAPNINFTRVRPGIKALEEGRLKVCTEPTKLEGSLVGINSFGFGGANAHCLLSKFVTVVEHDLNPLNDKMLHFILPFNRSIFQREIEQRCTAG